MIRKKISLISFFKVASLLTLTICLGCEDNFMNPNMELAELKNSYNLKEVANLPENVQAIEFNSISELELFLKSMKKKRNYKITGTSNQLNLMNITNHKFNNHLPRLKGGGIENGDMIGKPGGWWFQVLNINIYWGSPGDHNAIKINSKMDGFTFAAGYTQQPDGYAASWNSTNDTIKFHIDASEHYYLIFEGIGHVFSNNIEIDGYYVPSSGDYNLDINN